MGSHNQKLTGRYLTIFRIMILILILNWGVALAKTIYGWMTQSASMLADGIHSFSDGASNLIGMIGIWWASQPPDEDHPYGHEKYETFASLAIATFLFIVCFFILKDAVFNLFSPRVPQVTVISFFIMIVTIIINIGVTIYERKKAKELGSDILMSDSIHTQSDILTSFSVIVSLVCIQLGWPIVDSIASFFIGGFIGWAAFGIIKESSDVLCDRVVLNHDEIRHVVNQIEGVEDCHEIRTRGRKDHVYVDLHVLVDPKISVEEGHDVANRIEDNIKANLKVVYDVFVHIEPSTHHHPPTSLDKN